MSDDETPPGKDIEANTRFAHAGQKLGLEIWRVEDFEPVRRPESSYGTFYNGDAYLVLSTTTKTGSKKHHYDLHFWLGKKATQDERGAVALLAVELDEIALRGCAVQYRETQGHESKLFLSYFKKKFRYLEGGVASGFNEVEEQTFVKRLFQVKGRKNVRVEQVACKCASLNQGDTFVLDDGRHIYVWVGPKTGKKEQMTGMELARVIRDEDRNGAAHINVVEDWNTNEDFFRALGSRDKDIRAAHETDDDDIIRRLDQRVLVYQVEPNNDTVAMYEETKRPLEQSMLKSDKCYLLDAGPSGLFIWTGKQADTEFKKKVWEGVNLFLNKRGYPDWVQVTRVVEGRESPLFRQYWQSWEDIASAVSSAISSRVSSRASSRAASISEDGEPGEGRRSDGDGDEQDYRGVNGVAVKALHKARPMTYDWMPDDASGKVQVFRVDYNKLITVSEKAHGVFFGGDSYIILYTFGGRGDQREEEDESDEEDEEDKRHIVYFWQGSKSPVDERGASAAYALAVDKRLGGDAVQIRVVQQKEPAHFLRMFGGKLVYFMAGHVSGFRNMHDHDMYDPRAVHMFHVRGDSEDTARAIQVAPRASALNSNDVFVVDAPKQAFVWCGQFASEAEIQLGKKMVAYLAKTQKSDPVVMEEGEETLTFWNALGGQEKYIVDRRSKSLSKVIQPRLYQCSMSSGRFVVEEIVAFDQSDLDVDDVMILDTYEELFIWLGSNCKDFEKREAYKTAYQYLNTDPSRRSPDNTLIVVVRLGVEPPAFTSCFPGWNPKHWSEGTSFHELAAQFRDQNAGISFLEDEVKKFTAFYTLEELQRTVPPAGVDVMKKEMYLSPDEFQEVFRMSKEEFSRQPEWKQNNMKKHHRLF